MAEPFWGEIRIFSFDWVPKGWASCDGQLLPINQNQALFSLLGTYYGGNGQTNFALPNLKGRAPVHTDDIAAYGVTGGTERVTLSLPQMPAHGHLQATSNQATSGSPVGNVLANAARRGIAAFAQPAGTVVKPGSAGGDQPHPNMQPYLTLRFGIAMTTGIFPRRE
jgi:microcystin-dependent protein